MTSSWMEKRRLTALKRLGILDTAPEERFDRLTNIVRRIYQVPITLISLIDDDRQWFKSSHGVDLAETPREHAFCDHTIRQDKMFIVEDAANDVRFKDNPLVTGPPYVRFYAGMPIREPSGFKIGSLCIIDRVPRRVQEMDLDLLRNIASLVEDEIERAYLTGDHKDFIEVSHLTRSIHRAQNIFLTHDSLDASFEFVLNDLLALTASQFGFIGEILHHSDNTPYLKVGAITNIAWDPATEALYQQVRRRGMIFEQNNNLIGAALNADQAIIANDFPTDPRRGGLPEGHPAINSFFGAHIYAGSDKVGLIGLANRADGYSASLEGELEPLLQTVGQLIERKRLYREKTEHKQSLERAANYDSLTGLPNRRRLTELFQQEIVEADRRKGLVSVCFIDLDGFKEINDRYGHSTGDDVLKEVASRLKDSLRDHDVIARLGGDEFVAILRDVESDTVYDRILEAIRQPLSFGKHNFQLSGSMGVTVYPDDKVDIDLLLRHADQAMYAAKESGKNQFRHFDLESHVLRKERDRVLEQTPGALKEGQFELYLQPKINLGRQLVEGFEALIRWNHPTEGLLPPGAFLPHLEYTEFGADVGRFVLADAVAMLDQWALDGLPYSLSINLSPSHFLSDRFMADLESALAGKDPQLKSRLILEILETTTLDNTEKVIANLAGCKALGVQISLDDFGTGYSSLDYFRRLNVDEIKVDRSFVSEMLESPDDELIVGAIIGLSHNFGRRIVAEGIETQAVQDRLMVMGCEIGQGFYYTRPIPRKEALEWAATFSPGD
ncbi:sensor domain-containing phosphodiesterase [Marinobacter confluentis]|uniref:EAL domain-containing protein n=1 Tax=Marinobacter confluentis TaxID=1697557 RepID=A0A4Z1BC95_9GAMM|nr:EAL domain-containing protein [Marinobacter confluentis]TGN39804.1 EAL domain-containing protein [Marinobacter confluentis]